MTDKQGQKAKLQARFRQMGLVYAL